MSLIIEYIISNIEFVQQDINEGIQLEHQALLTKLTHHNETFLIFPVAVGCNSRP